MEGTAGEEEQEEDAYESRTDGPRLIELPVH